MKKASQSDALKHSIVILEIRRDVQLKHLKEHFQITYDSLRPVNILKNTLKELTKSPDLKSSISSGVIGIASGYILKNILFRSSYNPLKILAGIVVQSVATNLGAKNSDLIKTSVQKLFQL